MKRFNTFAKVLLSKVILTSMIVLCCVLTLTAAEYRTANFTVTCNDAELAKKIGDSAEFYRSKHAKEWLGAELPGKWFSPCPIKVKYGEMGAGGATTFTFDRGQVVGWNMSIQGTPQRILDSVVPHEVLHTVFASHFRRMVPRWADEGACTYCETESERNRNRSIVLKEVQPGELIPIRTLIALPEYPSDGRKNAIFYGQSFLLSEYLIDMKGKPEFISFLQTYFKSNDWSNAFNKHYGQGPELAYSSAVQANRPLSGALEVKLITDNPCFWCDKAKSETIPVLKDKGIKVNYVEKANSPEPVEGVPVFLLYRNGKRVGRIDGFNTATVVMTEFRKSQPKEVQVAQGVGIGVFGRNPDSSGRPNPHRDLSPAQMQIINQAIDSRSRVNIDNTISNRMGDMEKLIDARVKNAILEVQSKLTPEQKALINASAEQKAQIDSLKGQIEQVEASKAEFVKQSKEADAKAAEQNKALAKEVEATKNETNSLKDSLKGKVLEAVKAHVPDKLSGFASAIPGALQALSASGPIGLALYLGSRVLAARRKEDEPTEVTKQG